MKGGVEMDNPGKNQLSTSWRDFLNLRAGGRAVLVTFFSLLVADAAVETLLSGSPHHEDS
ncbi:MAG TPA: hypothetical protein VGX03_07100 [Candidatus Binatia bacterium]|nr:hypothetical protein [Candidatus Binatia bacterium]